MISGLHSCNPKNTPYVGDVKTFFVQELTGKSGKAYTKIKSASQNDGGRPYEVMSVTKTDYTDQYGNCSFNLEIQPVTIPDDRSKAAVPVQTAPQTRSEAAVRVQTNGGYEDRGNRIERQHSQSAAIAYATLKGLNDISPKDMVALIDWFQRDVSRVPTPPKKKAKLEAVPTEPYDMADEHPDNDGESDEF